MCRSQLDDLVTLQQVQDARYASAKRDLEASKEADNQVRSEPLTHHLLGPGVVCMLPRPLT